MAEVKVVGAVGGDVVVVDIVVVDHAGLLVVSSMVMIVVPGRMGGAASVGSGGRGVVDAYRVLILSILHSMSVSSS